MIRIVFSNKKIENEPGPNCYWRGEPQDYLKLVIDLHKLGREKNFEVALGNFDYIDIQDGYGVVLRTSENGNTLLAVNNKNILIDCTNDVWRQIIALFLSISFFPCHHYVEFDSLNLIEEANFIISSEKER
jgi:hypothetical protein